MESMAYDGHMTYIEPLDPNSRSTAAWDAYIETFDAEFPGWEQSETDPESRRYVSENDVELVSEFDRDDLQRVLDWEDGYYEHFPPMPDYDAMYERY